MNNSNPYNEFEYEEVPCQCGLTHEKNPSEFEIYELKIFDDLETGLMQTIKCPRCKTCKTISVLGKKSDQRGSNAMADLS